MDRAKFEAVQHALEGNDAEVVCERVRGLVDETRLIPVLRSPPLPI